MKKQHDGKGRHSEIVSFKASRSLATALSRIPNRSEFIRGALLNALDNICPLCCGTGRLTVDSAEALEQFQSVSSHRPM